MKIKVLLFVVCLSAFACAPKQSEKATSNNPKEIIGVINKDSSASPVITVIGKTNAPKTISAGKPEVIPNPNSDGLGASNFTNYNTEQGLALSSIDCGYRDKKGNLWFGTDGGGVSRYDGKSFTNFTTAQGLANGAVYSITEDKTGNLWFGTDGGGVSRYDGKSFTNFTMTNGLAH
ncbi:MAG TPA: two-component regulator propeller domain-containing protein, partial [Chitinophagaceae bacterium]|nr:two-component regulator propeller domain-containing protein [Chitinophagaceae bacterium]